MQRSRAGSSKVGDHRSARVEERFSRISQSDLKGLLIDGVAGTCLIGGMLGERYKRVLLARPRGRLSLRGPWLSIEET